VFVLYTWVQIITPQGTCASYEVDVTFNSYEPILNYPNKLLHR